MVKDVTVEYIEREREREVPCHGLKKLTRFSSVYVDYDFCYAGLYAC